jgi:hypothetical protein
MTWKVLPCLLKALMAQKDLSAADVARLTKRKERTVQAWLEFKRPMPLTVLAELGADIPDWNDRIIETLRREESPLKQS